MLRPPTTRVPAFGLLAEWEGDSNFEALRLQKRCGFSRKCPSVFGKSVTSTGAYSSGSVDESWEDGMPWGNPTDRLQSGEGAP